LERALTLNPRNVEALLNLGQYYMSIRKDATKAKGYLERFLKESPSDPQAKEIRALLKKL
ncbi:MAG: tetratricopeptide repeat protein, partial [Planctomycetota bacterium]